MTDEIVAALIRAMDRADTFRDPEERAVSIIDLLAVWDFRIFHAPAGSHHWDGAPPIICELPGPGDQES